MKKEDILKKIQYLKNKGYTYGVIANAMGILQSEITRLKKIRSPITEKRLLVFNEKLEKHFNINKEFESIDFKEKGVCIYKLKNDDNLYLEIDGEIKAKSLKISYFNKTKYFIG